MTSYNTIQATTAKHETIKNNKKNNKNKKTKIQTITNTAIITTPIKNIHKINILKHTHNVKNKKQIKTKQHTNNH